MGVPNTVRDPYKKDPKRPYFRKTTHMNLKPGTSNPKPLLGGSWAVISGVLSPLIWVITAVTLLSTLLITTPSKP